MPKGLLVAFSNPLPGEEDAYSAWFAQLVREALDVPGIVTAQRYRLAHQVPGLPPADCRYLALYGLDGDFEGIVKEAGRRRREGEWVPRRGMDMSRAKGWIFAPISHTGEPLR